MDRVSPLQRERLNWGWQLFVAAVRPGDVLSDTTYTAALGQIFTVHPSILLKNYRNKRESRAALKKVGDLQLAQECNSMGRDGITTVLEHTQTCNARQRQLQHHGHIR